MNVFGVPIEGWSKTELFKTIMERDAPFWVVTANPEILLAAKRDADYRAVLSRADVRLVDGFGLWLMLRLFGRKTSRVTGVDLTQDLIALAEEKKWRVGMIGGDEHVAEMAAKALLQTHPNLEITAEQGGRVGSNGADDQAGEEARHRLTMFAPHVLLVAFGHPKQEQWIARYQKDFPGLRVVVGVGGTLDFLAGRVKRAPSLMRRIGLEWLWRLFIEPRRMGRIWNAVVIFPFFFLMDRLSEPFDNPKVSR